ncbi:YitT family protein [Aeromicrobium camelliae]|uniref:YitT family protein n=1 Tax=Aeromicrobium camelliae TaxID=1538144 RepID=A0A3N6XZP6_9ACTN|nr:YitT family protein [Aeromicrobium camelliae]RQN03194.1 YitT family protein [Aeromicrobium camelliae]
MEPEHSEQDRDGSEPSTVTLPHTPAEDVLGVLTGTFLASLGLYLLNTSQAVTGGTAGLSLLLSYAVAPPFAVLFVAVNLPFFALAVWKKGWLFTGKTVVAVLLVSGFSSVHQHVMPLDHLDPVYAVITGNLLAGVGLLILFRHGASLGGFNILALILQERAGLRAGYVQMGLDVAVVVAALAVVPVTNVALSAAGAVVLNIVLAFNHRPERYRA